LNKTLKENEKEKLKIKEENNNLKSKLNELQSQLNKEKIIIII